MARPTVLNKTEGGRTRCKLEKCVDVRMEVAVATGNCGECGLLEVWSISRVMARRVAGPSTQFGRPHPYSIPRTIVDYIVPYFWNHPLSSSSLYAPPTVPLDP